MKKAWCLACLTLWAMVLSGCTGLLATEELYRLPQLPVEYTQLQALLEDRLEQGAEYAAPVSGSHLQPVQMVDLNGDGQQEALAFLRSQEQEQPLRICIYTAEGDSYTQWAEIAGSGTEIYSVSYQDLNGDNSAELIVGWRVSAEVQALCVYELSGGSPKELLTSNYVRYTVTDLDSDGQGELMILRTNSQGESVAERYVWVEGTLVLNATAPLSMTMSELSQRGKVHQGVLLGSQNALFITGVTNTSLAVVDVLTLENGGLNNVVRSDVTGFTTEFSPFYDLYPTDIDGDGLTEVPVAVALPSLSQDPEDTTPVEYRVDWVHFDTQGNGQTALYTYHNTAQGWYFVLPQSWRGLITAQQHMVGDDESAVTFYRLEEGAEPQAFLRICTITGESREYKAVRGNRFVLRRQATTITTAEFLTANDGWEFALSQDDVRSGFYSIATEWVAGEN